MRRFLQSLLTTCFILIFTPFAVAQVANVTNTTSTPIPGAGHDYINMLTETVNPPNGSVSLRIQVPTPKARALSIPFSFNYDSNGTHFVVPAGNGLSWSSDASSNPPVPYIFGGGWSYSIPTLTSQGVALTQVVNGKSVFCDYRAGFVFRDRSGARHSLGLLNTIKNTTTACETYFTVDPVTSAQEGPYQANLDNSSGTITIADPSGTVYTFLSGGNSTPSSIQDRNGNVAGCCGDDAGRAVVTLAYSTTSPNTPTTVTVTGLSNPYTITSGTASSNFTIATTLLDASPCAGPTSLSNGQTQSTFTAITLPNGKSFQFQYDSTYGLLTKVVYPSGGYVSYTWGLNTQSDVVTVKQSDNFTCHYRYDSFAVMHRYVSFDGTNVALQQDFSYSTTWNTSPAASQWTAKQTTVTTHDLLRPGQPTFQTVYSYFPTSAPTQPPNYLYAGQIPVEGAITYKDSNGNVLRTTSKTGDLYRVLSQCETLDNGLTSGTFYTYGPGIQITDKKEYDYGLIASGTCQQPSTAAARETAISYQSFANTAIFPSASSILDRPSSVKTYGNGTLVAETDYTYDNPIGTVTSGIVQHGAGCNCGNLTVQSQWLNTSGSNLTTNFTNDDTGQRLTMTDPRGNQTTYSYTDSYSSGTPPGPTNAYLTQVTLPQTSGVSHIEKYAYAYDSGQLTSATGQNNQVTTYKYNDNLARLTETDYPDGGVTTFAYNDAAYNASTPSPSLTTTKKINSSTNLVTVSAMDGLGQVVRSELTSDPSGTTYTDITRDGLGRVWKQSNLYRTTGDSTYGITTNYFDALGRPCLVVPPDGTLPTGNTCPATQSANTVFTTYSGNTTTVTDQAGKSRNSVTDGLGRLTQVFEDPAGLNYETDYAYDALDNLLTVNQKGGSTNSANWRTRTFTYNSLSQLLTAANPESGTITYAYDNNGNLLTKVAPAPNQTGSATVTTTFTYDQLNRLTQKSFSDGVTPTVKYGYDAVAPSGCTPPALTITNGIGRRTSMCDAAGAEAWSYDSMGRPLADQRTTNSITKATTYTYNLDGSIATLVYPSGRTITYTLASSGSNTAGRLSSAVDSTGPINYATGALYSPAGALSSFTNGASIVSTYFYNNRLQPCRISVKNTGAAPASCTDAATGNALDFSYNFSLGASDNGNVTAITNNRDTTRSQSFTYDALNRIATAKTTSTTGTTCWDEAFSYDPWGNLLSIGRISGYTCSNEELLSVTATTNNQISGDTFDAAGNLITIPAIANYTYDAENHLKTAAGVTYTYDGDGKRVQKSNGKLYWYGMGSDPLDETDLVGNTNNSSFNEYVFFGGKRIARRDSSNNVNYYFADHLGTARIVANSSGTPVDDSDFYPFGGERVYLNSSPQNYKFTGKERDSESGLDNFGARYDASSLGRFMSPDPLMASAHVGDPQSWNRYTYALNNPLRFVDPTGMDPGCGSGDNSKCKVTIRVNVIYDKNANNGKGLTDQQKKDFQDKTLAKAIKDFGKSGIGVQVTYTAGSLTVDNGNVAITGLQSSSLNLLVSGTLPTGNAGESAPPDQNGTHMSMVGVDDAHNVNLFPFFTNTVEHEITHQLKGDPENPELNPGQHPVNYMLNEVNVNFRSMMMGWGVKQDTLVSGAQTKPYTVQPKQDNIRPRTDQ